MYNHTFLSYSLHYNYTCIQFTVLLVFVNIVRLQLVESCNLVQLIQTNIKIKYR